VRYLPAQRRVAGSHGSGSQNHSVRVNKGCLEPNGCKNWRCGRGYIFRRGQCDSSPESGGVIEFSNPVQHYFVLKNDSMLRSFFRVWMRGVEIEQATLWDNGYNFQQGLSNIYEMVKNRIMNFILHVCCCNLPLALSIWCYFLPCTISSLSTCMFYTRMFTFFVSAIACNFLAVPLLWQLKCTGIILFCRHPVSRWYF
jgi:hypothetical protein